MIGRSFLCAIASITCQLKKLWYRADDNASRIEHLDRIDKRDTGALSWANGFWKFRRSLRRKSSVWIFPKAVPSFELRLPESSSPFGSRSSTSCGYSTSIRQCLSRRVRSRKLPLQWHAPCTASYSVAQLQLSHTMSYPNRPFS